MIGNAITAGEIAMTDQISEPNLYREANLSYETSSCRCVIDSRHDRPDDPPIDTLKVSSNCNAKVKFVFVPTVGLVRISANKGVFEERNVLGAFLSIKKDSPKAYVNFFEKNGFLFPVSSDKYEEVDAGVLKAISERLELTVELMNDIGGPGKKNYGAILEETLGLLFAEPFSLTLCEGKITYKSCVHAISNEIAKNIPEKDVKQEVFDAGVLTVKDSIFGECKIDYSKYCDVMTGKSEDLRIREIYELYLNDRGAEKELQNTIDFIFHFFYDGEKPEELSGEMKEALLSVAKNTLKEEIDSNVKGVSAAYDAEKLTPRWEVDSLMTALYFSLYYMKPDVELMKLCENPRCGKYFKVSRSNGKQKYCCPECRRRAGQTRHRLRLKASIDK
jgi:hypothetical protein